MGKKARKEYLAAIRGRYRKAGRMVSGWTDNSAVWGKGSAGAPDRTGKMER
ncbi:MAG: hypothetical protein HQK86_03600 [Nitrospinae bacterium]|nr:hypothetical protein [Nitrospinota bacterium]